MMRKILFLLMLLSTSACSPTWWQDFKDNPVQQTDIYLNTAVSVENVAIIAFNQLKQFLPTDKQAEFQAKFDNSVVALNKAMQTVRDAVKAAADARQDSPDFAVVIADVVKAIKDVRDVVAEVRNILKTPPAADGKLMTAPKLFEDTSGYILMNDLVDSLK